MIAPARPGSRPPLSEILPPLIFGTATFNSQYNPDPYALPTTKLVHRAFTHGIRAFDTSPYYGPSEDLLGQALSTALPGFAEPVDRETYFLLTKVGRISGTEFNYSSSWVRQSVARSLERLRTTYLDVVYCHDVEFVSEEDVLEAVITLRKIRDEDNSLRYVGICGYPLDTLVRLSRMILQKTGEPLDIVQSYANFTLQNRVLGTESVVQGFLDAGVDVVPNASILGMGLVRSNGPPVGGQGDWHPAPRELQSAIHHASIWVDGQDDRIEKVAIRWSIEEWINVGARVGSAGDGEVAEGHFPVLSPGKGRRIGVSVMGVSKLEELEETMSVWKSVLDAAGFRGEESSLEERTWAVNRKEEVQRRVEVVQRMLGSWLDYTWASGRVKAKSTAQMKIDGVDGTL